MIHGEAAVLRHVRRLRAAGAGEVSDGQLLGRFAACRDGDAFASLVRRHGPMVLHVCGRVLGDRHAAEDAFQATFLLLARKAGTVGRRGTLAGWLYGVAYRTALRARADALRRRRRESAAAPRPADDPAAVAGARELASALDEELSRLPERFRTPLVLCLVEGRTRDQAARVLGLSLRTLERRLEGGRELLRARLTRRGVTLSAALLAAGLSPAASAAVAAPLVAAVTAAVSRPADASTPGLLHILSLIKLRRAAVCLAVASAFGLCGLAYRAAESPRPDAGAAAGKAAVQLGRPPAADPDADGDGLPNFQEVHKYRTDPRRKDTAGDGTPDGGWDARREHTYSVRAVVRVMRPVNLATLNDDYQDARVLKATRDYVDLEVVTYPLNTNADAIRGNPTWRKDYAGMKEYLAPGVTTDWDADMRSKVLVNLKSAGIDPDMLTDKEVVEKVSRWLFDTSWHKNMFCTYYVHFPGGKPAVLPGLEAAFDREKGDKGWTAEEQFAHELLGREMFARKTYGTCTSAAVYQATVLRALGIPTRFILTIPVVDPCDEAQVEMAYKNLKHHRVRNDVFYGLDATGHSFANHTYLEVFVGGRWRRLNYKTLGQNVLDRNYLGLMVKVNTFNDLSEADLAATWGRRYALGRRDEDFRYSNPYRTLEIGDHFGRHARVPNPPAADKELHRITVGKAYWFDSDEAPKELKDSWPREHQATLFLHGEEWLTNHVEYRVFLKRADRNFVLRAEGRPDVRAAVTVGFYTAPASGLREIAVVVPAKEYARMARGVAYTLHALNANPDFRWKVRDGVTLTRK